MSTDGEPPKAGPLEALLLGIELAKRTAETIASNEEDGPTHYVLYARDWLGILECADQIATRLVLARGDNPTRYVPDE